MYIDRHQKEKRGKLQQNTMYKDTTVEQEFNLKFDT